MKKYGFDYGFLFIKDFIGIYWDCGFSFIGYNPKKKTFETQI